MQWIYLSPHPDDAALSCGGLIWEQSNSGDQVSIWTICAGDPPDEPLSPFAETLHRRWGIREPSGAARRLEDLQSCAILGAAARHFLIPDCIYRRSPRTNEVLYGSEEAIFNPIHPDEAELVSRLAGWISGAHQNGARVVAPLALGGHVDHRLVRAAAEESGVALGYYADYPYVLKEADIGHALPRPGISAKAYPVSDAGLAAWVSSVAAHASQISTFWPDLIAMGKSVEQYCHDQDGVRLWWI